MAHPSRSPVPAKPAQADPVPFVRGLKGIVPPELVDRVLVRTRRKEKRKRRLPALSVVWLVVAMSLFSSLSVPKAFRALHPSRDKEEPDDSAFPKARARLGVRPMRELFDEVSAGLAPEGLPGVRHKRWRLMGIDGSVFDVPDSPENEAVFGRLGNQRSPYAFPQLRVLALCELGVRVRRTDLHDPEGHFPAGGVAGLRARGERGGAELQDDALVVAVGGERTGSLD